MDITFREGATPHAVYKASPIPHHWQKPVKDDIDRDVRLRIIEAVPQGTVSEWCSRMVVVAKKDGSPRRTVDLQKLNEATYREVHHTQTPFNLVSTVPKNTYKTVVDAWNGYHSLPLSPEAKDATTFLTIFGRYRYCRAPMGFHASGDAYTKRFDDITVGQPRTARCVDDSLLWDTGIEQAFWHTFDYIKLCADNGIVFNREKFVFAQLRAEFAGFEITEDSYRPPEHILASISNFPVPKSVTDVKSFFGLVNQVAYAFSQADTMAPFRELLKKEKDKRLFYWDDTLQTVFDEAKREIVRQVCEGVRSFELNRPTCLATDWSKAGLGYTLTQRHCDCPDPPVPNCGPGHWKLVLVGSRFTKDPKTRYAPIEGEALALVQGLQSCRMFTLGCPDLIVAVDHKPLIKIFNDRELDTISNPRLLQLKEKTLMYKFRIVYIPGVTNDAADAMSRYPSSKSMESEVLVDDEVSVAFATTQIRPEDLVTWQDVNTAAASDQECIDLANAIREGFPKLKTDLPVSIRQFWPMRDNLYMIENVPFRDAKMLVPKPLRKRILEGLHAAHQGVNGMLANARQRLFWPGLDAAIRLTRAQC